MSFNIKEEKNRIREIHRSKRKSLSESEKEKLDRQTCQMLLSLREYENEDRIFAYVGKTLEVDTLKFIQTALDDNKMVFVPACIKNTCEMEFYRINSLSELKVGSFGILEPDVNKNEKAHNYESGLCIVPGFCFDRRGFRLGYGKGYYDRFLLNFKGKAVGVTYSENLEDVLPHGRFDRYVDAIVTERYIIRVRKNYRKEPRNE